MHPVGETSFSKRARRSHRGANAGASGKLFFFNYITWSGISRFPARAVIFPESACAFIVCTFDFRRHGIPASQHLSFQVYFIMLCNVKSQFRSEENTYELQSLMRHSYAVYCLK